MKKALKNLFILTVAMTVFMVSCTTEDPEDDILIDSDLIGGNDNSGLPDDNITTDDNVTPDNSGLPDEEEDEDVLPELDSDGDGISDDIEKPNGVAVDTDDDGTPDYLDDDSDGDGIPDSIEGVADTDGDGTSDYRDDESDGDNILDNVECKEQPCVDTDEDGVPDYLDDDSDGDTIPDLIEGIKDSDKDTVPDYLDDDSDGDGILDKDEAGTVDIPADSDDDGHPDYIDLDSDNDGLSDTKENEIGTDPTKIDTDGDTFDDNTEIAAGSDPLVSDPEFYEGQFYVVLPYNDPEKKDLLEFDTKIKKADILFHFDLTGSMANAIDTVKNDISSIIIPGVKAMLDDPAFGIASYKHIESTPHVMNQPVTTDAAKLQTALNNMTAPGSGSIDSQYETLFQGASGHGFDGELLKFDEGDCFDNLIMCVYNYDQGNMDVYYDHYHTVSLAPQNCTGQMGHIGGGCFREAALPIQILMTDEALYNVDEDILSDKGITAYNYIWNDSKPDQGHYREDVKNAMNAINSKFMGIMGTSLTSELLETIQDRMKEIADDTESKTADGRHFIFQVGYSGGGLSDEVVTAINDLLLNIKRDITTKKMSVANIYSIDTTLFIKKMIPDSSIPANNYDSMDNEWFYNVRPNTKVLFDLTFENTIFEPETTENTLFLAKIYVYGEGAILDTRNVYIIVPGIKDDGGIKD